MQTSADLTALISPCSTSRDFGLHNPRDPGRTTSSAITATEYGTLQDAYDYLNLNLFEGSLPQVFITLQRHPRALGYFSANRFQRRADGQQRVHEIALNPDGFTGNADEKILATLGHEMVHVWQQEFGRRGRGRYHNRQWARKMHSIGLGPSSTGKPGGATTGDSMSHYIIDGGKYQATCREFLKRYQLVWESSTGSATGLEGDDNDHEGGKKSPTRLKFTCPICGLNVWAKPGAQLLCGPCSRETGELIPLLREGEAEPTQPSRDGDAAMSQYDRVIEIMTNATNTAKRANICLEEFLPALVDFTATVALGVHGEECLRAFIVRMEGRIDDWRAGIFPVDDSGRPNNSAKYGEQDR